MNTATLDFAPTEPPLSDDPVSRSVAERWPMMLKVLVAILAIGTLAAFILYSQMGATMERIGQLENRNAALERTNSEFTRKVASLPKLQKELADTKRLLGLETAEKNRLAVLLTRSEAGRKQAVADHAAALRQIAALEKAGAGKKQPKRK